MVVPLVCGCGYESDIGLGRAKAALDALSLTVSSSGILVIPKPSLNSSIDYVMKWEASSQMKDHPNLASFSWNSACRCHGLLVRQESKLLNGVCFVVIQQGLEEHRLAPSDFKGCQDVSKKKQRHLTVPRSFCLWGQTPQTFTGISRIQTGFLVKHYVRKKN